MNATSKYSFASSPTLRFALAFIGVSLIIALGMLRANTHAQFTFASLMLLPVLMNAWLIGRTGGWFSAVLAALMWGYADHVSANAEDAVWIPSLNALVHLMNYGIVIELVLKVRMLLERESDNARIDKLTGLLNRRGFIGALEEQVSLAKRLGSPLAIAFIDLDRFKQLNDTRGHNAGDAALKLVGVKLAEAARSTDLIGRLGGDEFCVLAFAKSSDDAKAEAVRLHTQLTKALSIYSPVGVSIGVAFFEMPEMLVADMIELADQTMYAVKQSGKGDVLVRSF